MKPVPISLIMPIVAKIWAQFTFHRNNRQGNKIVLEDAGKPFEPAEVLPPDLESPLEIRAERGLGVFLIKHSWMKSLLKIQSQASIA